MKIKPELMVKSIVECIKLGKTFAQWKLITPALFAMYNGKRYTAKDIETNFAELSAEVREMIGKLWDLNPIPVKPKDNFRAAKCGGSMTIRQKKFAPKKCCLIFRSMGIPAGKKDRRK